MVYSSAHRPSNIYCIVFDIPYESPCVRYLEIGDIYQRSLLIIQALYSCPVFVGNFTTPHGVWGMGLCWVACLLATLWKNVSKDLHEIFRIEMKRYRNSVLNSGFVHDHHLEPRYHFHCLAALVRLFHAWLEWSTLLKLDMAEFCTLGERLVVNWTLDNKCQWNFDDMQKSQLKKLYFKMSDHFISSVMC